jgi:hypothetical protein
LSGSPRPPSPRTAGRHPHCGSATFVQALAGSLATLLLAVTGITNKHLRVLMTGLLNRPYSMNQASYDLARLSRNQLIQRIPGQNKYAVTRDGLLFAHLYTKIYQHVLFPLMNSDRPNAPPELRNALGVIDQIITDRITAAKVPINI